MQLAEEQVAKTRSTEASAFDALLAAHFGVVRKVAASYARAAEDRHDLSQEICLQAWKAFPRYDPSRAFATWLYRIALNVSISTLRSRTPEREAAALDEQLIERVAVSAAPELDERIELLQRFIARLDPLDRAVMLLYLEEYSYREIAEVVGMTETNVATRISRLKQRVRDDIVQHH